MKIDFENLEPVFKTRLGATMYDRGNKALYFKYEGMATLDMIKELFEPVITFVSKNPMIYGVHDMTNVKGTFTQANSYMKDRISPAFMAAGCRYVGLITSADPFTKFAINTAIKLITPKGLEMKMFNSLEKCEEWMSGFEVSQNSRAIL